MAFFIFLVAWDLHLRCRIAIFLRSNLSSSFKSRVLNQDNLFSTWWLFRYVLSVAETLPCLCCSLRAWRTTMTGYNKRDMKLCFLSVYMFVLAQHSWTYKSWLSFVYIFVLFGHQITLWYIHCLVALIIIALSCLCSNRSIKVNREYRYINPRLKPPSTYMLGRRRIQIPRRIRNLQEN